METSGCRNSVAGHQIETNFCTCHDSTAVVPCTKFCSDQGIIVDVRVKRNFHRIELRRKNRQWNGARIGVIGFFWMVLEWSELYHIVDSIYVTVSRCINWWRNNIRHPLNSYASAADVAETSRNLELGGCDISCRGAVWDGNWTFVTSHRLWGSNLTFILTHWGRDKMDAFFQTTFSNGFSWVKMYGIRLEFNWNLFLRFEIKIFQHWFR